MKDRDRASEAFLENRDEEGCEGTYVDIYKFPYY